MSIEDLLLELRDIQVPAAPGWFPLAPGWWILLAVSFFSLIVGVIYMRRRRQYNFQLAQQELRYFVSQYQDIEDKRRLLLGLSRWLRQVAILAFPEREIAGLTGHNWVEFLDETMPGSEFTGGHGYIFAGEVYAAQADIDANDILSLCQTWLDRVKPRLIDHGGQ